MKKILDSIFGNDYKVKLFGEGCILELKSQQLTGSISIRFLRYNGIVIDSAITARKRFDAVENILIPVLERNEIPKIGFWPCTIKHSYHLSEVPGFDASFVVNRVEIDKKNEEQVFQVFSELRKAVDFVEHDFFTKYSTLEAAYHASEAMEIVTMADFIQQPLPFRRMVIKRLMNDSTFDKYCIDYIADEKADENPPSQFKNFARAAEDLYEVLKGIPPLK